MAERVRPKTTISVEEVLRTEIIVNQALIDILLAKRIISEEELVDSIRKIRHEQETMIHGSSNTVSLKQADVKNN
jgi:hypothetical protein